MNATLRKEHTALAAQLHSLRSAQHDPGEELATAQAAARTAEQRVEVLERLNGQLQKSKAKAQGDALELAAKLKEVTAKHMVVVKAHKETLAALDAYRGRAQADSAAALETIRSLEARCAEAEAARADAARAAQRAHADSSLASGESHALVSELRMQLADAQAQRDALRAELDDALRTIAVLEAARDDARDAADTAATARDAALVAASDADAKLRAAERQLDALRLAESHAAQADETSDAVEVQIAELRAQLGAAHRERDAAIERARVAKDAVARATARSDALRAELEQVSTDYTAATQDALDAEAETAEAHVEIAALRDALAAAESRASSVAQHIRSVESELSTQRVVSASFDADMVSSALNDSMHEREPDAELARMVALLKTELANLKAAAAATAQASPPPASPSASAGVRQQLADLRAMQNATAAKHAAALDEVKTAHAAARLADAATLSALRDQLNASQAEAEAARAKVSELHDQLVAQEASAAAKLAVVDAAANERIAAATARASKLAAELDSVRTAAIARQGQAAEASAAVADRELEALRKQITSVEAAKTELGAQLSSLTDHWTQLAGQYESSLANMKASHAAYEASAGAALASYKQALGDQKRKLAKGADELSQARNAYRALESKTVALELERDELAAALRVAEARGDASSQSLEVTPVQLAAMRSQVEDLADQLERATQLADSRKLQIADMRSQQTKLAALYEEQASALEHTQRLYKSQVDDALADAAALRAELESAQAVAAVAAGPPLSPVREERTDAKVHTDHLEAQLADARAMTARATAMYEAEHVALVRERSQRAEVVREFEARIAQLEAMVGTVVAKLRASLAADTPLIGQRARRKSARSKASKFGWRKQPEAALASEDEEQAF
ncbi:uncharacterized protein AMSG_02302 [Thecamonas trahens ATCC 50062]|uniref:Uncharacterized protein n=1 Tax=Thecamonas trahens ATCC 50062 TaxID=461836 RepID=A0A0L0DVX8_THETB|nr:hypothetical protein AMSG_02302 [Thecamonas trahens ATCC 50062]KNC56332.1 hypothetical protein AMSG_02302 [Thecamonas trahens ATCC 50062]|eukprot:XP_013760849.1 hypothetical protein AMSG_02302 [Thecamonas trahens ATCC 50062]